MGIFPNWLKEFPGTLWETFVSNAKQNLPEFRDEVLSGMEKASKGVTAVVQGAVKIVTAPLQKPLIIIAIILILVLIFWKKFQKLGII